MKSGINLFILAVFVVSFSSTSWGEQVQPPGAGSLGNKVETTGKDNSARQRRNGEAKPGTVQTQPISNAEYNYKIEDLYECKWVTIAEEKESYMKRDSETKKPVKVCAGAVTCQSKSKEVIETKMGEIKAWKTAILGLVTAKTGSELDQVYAFLNQGFSEKSSNAYKVGCKMETNCNVDVYNCLQSGALAQQVLQDWTATVFDRQVSFCKVFNNIKQCEKTEAPKAGKARPAGARTGQ